VQNTKLNSSICKVFFPVHKTRFQFKYIYSNAQNSIPVEMYLFQCTKLDSSSNIFIPVHKTRFQLKIFVPVQKTRFQLKYFYSSAQNPIPVEMYLFQCTKLDSSGNIFIPVHKTRFQLKYIYSCAQNSLPVEKIYFSGQNSILVKIYLFQCTKLDSS